MTLEEISAEAAPETDVTPENTDETPAEKESETPETPIENAEESTPDPTDILKNLPPRKKTAAERIAELTWKAHEKEREADYWRQQATGKTPDTPKATPTNGRPKLEQFETQEEYEDALLDWHSRQSFERTQAEKQKEREEEAVRQFNIKAMKLREIHDDFDEVVNMPVFTKTMRSVLLTSEQGPVMAYYLGRPENIQAAQRIASLPSELQPYEIGKLETQLLLAQKTKKVPSAPPPITPVGGTATPTVDDDKLSDDEWYARERQRRLEKLKQKHGG